MLSAILLASVFAATTVGAPAVTTGSPCANGGAPGNTLAWVAAGTGQATAKMTGAFDTQLAVRHGGVQIACNDDATPGSSASGSLVSWPVVAGATYQVIATGFSGEAGGPYALTITGPAAVDPCPHPPDFTIGAAKACADARQVLQCACSEAIEWTAAPGAEWYEVVRANPDGTSLNVGDTRARLIAVPGPYPDSDFTTRPATWWIPAWDSEPVHAGEIYGYRIRACCSLCTPMCGAWTDAPIRYAAAPIACIESGKEVACWSGAALLMRTP